MTRMVSLERLFAQRGEDLFRGLYSELRYRSKVPDIPGTNLFNSNVQSCSHKVEIKYPFPYGRVPGNRSANVKKVLAEGAMRGKFAAYTAIFSNPSSGDKGCSTRLGVSNNSKKLQKILLRN